MRRIGRGSLASILSSRVSVVPSVANRSNIETPKEIEKASDELPIAQYREEIISKINNNHVTLINAETGSGKTTQVPQFILDDAKARGEPCNILISQPRKIAAITNAKRVSQERKCELGSEVGYQVGLKKKVDTEMFGTRLLFCTTGVILEKLILEQNMVKYTHIILDEVHEREIDMDLLITIVREFLLHNSKSTKVILMSATFSMKAFVRYFTLHVNSTSPMTPAIVELKTKRNFDIKTFYLDDLSRFNIDQEVNYSVPRISQKLFLAATELIVERLNLSSKSILVFLPGIYEINSLHTILQEDSRVTDSCLICVLHSSLPTDDQRIAFMPASKPKIVLSTNIAESSITIKEVDCIIDFCLAKYVRVDEQSSMASLKLDWTSQSSLEQRSGRTGRTCDGSVYRMIHRRFYNNLTISTVPEMQRCPLETVVLRIKMLGMESPNSLLSKTMDCPHVNAIRRSVLILKELGALQRISPVGFNVNDGKLTYIGRIMAALPLDVRMSKLIVVGFMFSILNEAIVIAAGLTIKSIFRSSFQQGLVDYSHKLAWSDGSACDLISIVNAYNLWILMSEQGHFTSWEVEMKWCKQFNLERKSLHEMRELIRDIKNRLTELKMEPMKGAYQVTWEPKTIPLMLKFCAAAAFIPNFFIFGQKTEEYQREVYKEVAGRNPTNTVYFKKMDKRYVGEVYDAQLKVKLVEAGICRNTNGIKITFDKGSTKVFVEFNDGASMVDTDEYGAGNVSRNFQQEVSTFGGKIKTEVYKAVKLRKSGWNLTIDAMNATATEAYAEANGIDIKSRIGFLSKNVMKHPELCVIPTTCTKRMIGIITHIVHCGMFYIQPATDENKEILNAIEAFLNQDCVRYESVEDLCCYQLVIACDVEADKRKRARVEGVNIAKQMVLCFMIDYGETKRIPINQILRISECHKSCFEIPERCFESTLSEITPSFFKCPRGKWTSDAIETFRNLTLNLELTVVVHSVIEDVASVQLWNEESFINEELVNLGFAQECEEDFPRKLDYETRELVQSQPSSYFDAKVEFVGRIDTVNKKFVPPPPISDCRTQLKLYGPISPLETKANHILVHNPQSSTEISIDPLSVNSILFCTNPESIHGQLLIAANITKNNFGVVLHETTIIPDIPGIPILLGMMFAPVVIFRRNVTRTHYESVQFGLGGNPLTKESLFQEHDCTLHVNIELDYDDFKEINLLRYQMSYLLKTDPTEIIPSLEDITKYQLLVEIKAQLAKILGKTRAALPSCEQFQSQETWETEKQSDAHHWKDPIRDGSIYQFIDYPPLYSLDEIKKAALQSKLDDIIKEVECATLGGSKTKSCYTCPLCNSSFENTFTLKIHFSSKMHLNSCKVLNINDA